jgi:hypothetical protein
MGHKSLCKPFRVWFLRFTSGAEARHLKGPERGAEAPLDRERLRRRAWSVRQAEARLKLVVIDPSAKAAVGAPEPNWDFEPDTARINAEAYRKHAVFRYVLCVLYV